MQEVKLYTRDHGYVTTVIIPAFIIMPDAIVWGSRTFVLSNGIYCEGFAYVATITKGETE